MIPELGHFALLVALLLTVIQATIPIIGAQKNYSGWMVLAGTTARMQFFFHVFAFALLTYSFIEKDFSVLYVATNSNAELPLHYRISAVWGAHEGSLLLWSLILSGWTFAVTLSGRHIPLTFKARVIAVMGWISVGFLLFMLFTSNPFARLSPAATNGQDLNPLLQDIGLIFHPPMLYMGYVGLVVPFAFAIAALIEGNVDAAWTRWTRPWTTVAWVFLTIGITLGSWWAYYELGWGGWWFWDPVENASFMPWLVATALIHSLAVTETRNVFRAWTVLLAIFAFSLSLLGTFLVRSGVLVSVHAFATDPARGVFILIFLAIIVGSALILFAFRAPRVSGGNGFKILSRETFLLVNNVILVVASGSVLLGTLYPLILDALDAGKISVGPPYFNSVFIPLMFPLLLLIGIGPLLRWKEDTLNVLINRLKIPLLISVTIGVILVLSFTESRTLMVVASIATAIWIVVTSILGIIERLSNKPTTGNSLARLPRNFIGMTLAHTGVAVFVIGVVGSSVYSVEKDVRLSPGERYKISDYSFELVNVTDVNGPNYVAQVGRFHVYKKEKLVATLSPEKRFYPIQKEPMTEAAISPTLSRDLYIALGEPLGEDAWSVRLYYKPLQRWIWLGPLLMAFGGIIAATDKRYRRTRKHNVPTKDALQPFDKLPET